MLRRPNLRAAALIGAVTALLPGRGTAQPSVGPAPLSHDIAPHAGENSFLVHRLHQPGLGSVNTWVIENDRALILIDGQRSRTAGRAVAAMVTQRRKPVAAVVLTHPHPDHIGGLPDLVALRAPGAPLLGLARTAEILRTDAQGYIASSVRQMGEDFAAAPQIPDRLVADGEVVEIAGLRIICREYRDVEAPVMLVLEIEGSNAVFVADMVENGMTPFLVENRVDGWLAGLDALAAALPVAATAYPGHGPAGSARVLIAAQQAYLRRVATLARGGESPPAVVATIQREYPGYLPVAALPDLLERNVAALRGG